MRTFRALSFTFSLIIYLSSTLSYAAISLIEIDGIDEEEKAFSIKIENIESFASFDLSSIAELTVDKTIKELRLGTITDEPKEVLVEFRQINSEILKSLNWVRFKDLKAESPSVVALFEQLNSEHFRYDISSSHDGFSINFSPLDMSFELSDEEDEENGPLSFFVIEGFKKGSPSSKE